MMARMVVRMLAVALGMGLASAGWATDSKYQTYIVGDRAAGMGGAVVSIADSVDACYYNPAGLTEVKSRSRNMSIMPMAAILGFERWTFSIRATFFPRVSRPPRTDT